MPSTGAMSFFNEPPLFPAKEWMQGHNAFQKINKSDRRYVARISLLSPHCHDCDAIIPVFDLHCCRPRTSRTREQGAFSVLQPTKIPHCARSFYLGPPMANPPQPRRE